jgi:hypothetical protein
MTEEQRNHYGNLIYLCRDHHREIDRLERDYPIDLLLAIKADHESQAREGMDAAFAEVGFPELARAIELFSMLPVAPPSEEYTIIPPEEKIRKNELSPGSRRTILMGMVAVREVQAFIEHEAKSDPDFPERLKAGFLEEYYCLRREGHRGDELFDLMCHFSQRGMKAEAMRCAGKAILIYLFEQCEVFEK